MWKTINLLLHKKFADANSPSNNIKIDGKICDNQLAMGEFFNNFFGTSDKRLVGKTEEQQSKCNSRHLTDRIFSLIFLESVDKREIMNIINLLPMKNLVGRDNIPFTFF